jgi:NADPH2:quinone reductase
VVRTGEPAAAVAGLLRLPVQATIRRFSYWLGDEPYRVDLATLVDNLAAGRLHPEIGVIADWRETPEVLVALSERRIRGHAALTVGPSS